MMVDCVYYGLTDRFHGWCARLTTIFLTDVLEYPDR